MKKPKITKNYLKKLILPTIILIQFVLLAAIAWHVNLLKVNDTIQSQSPPTNISQLIIKAIEAINWPVPTDAKTGKVYFYQSKLTLPPVPPNSGGLYYFYTPLENGQPELLSIKDKQNVDIQKAKIYASSNVDEAFDVVPKLQACSRGYQVVFTKSGKGYVQGKLIFTKKLSDGRTARVYLDQGCTDNSDQMIPYFKQMESY